MLDRKAFTRAELDDARAAVEARLAAWRGLLMAVAGGPDDSDLGSAVATLEAVVFNDALVVLDRPFVGRPRAVMGTGTDPLTEVELLVDGLTLGGGVLRSSAVITWQPERSVLGLRVGDPIRLTGDAYERLARAFLTELEHRFLRMVGDPPQE